MGNKKNTNEQLNKKSDESISKSEEQYRVLAESAPDSIFLVSPKGKMLYINKFGAKSFGLNQEEAIGKTQEEVFPPEVAKFNREQITKLLRTQKPYLVEEKLNLPIGEVYISAWLTPVKDAEGRITSIVVISRDITEQKKIKKDYERLYKETQVILRSAAEGAYGVDNKGNCVFVNRAALEMLQYKPRELIGKHMHEIIHHSHPDGSFYPEKECAMYKAYRTGKESRIDHDILWRKDGTSFPVQYSSSPIIDKGKVKGAIACFSDITERKKAEANIDKRLRIESVAADIATILVQAKDLNKVFNLLLKKFGKLIKVNRAYVFFFKDGISKMDNTNEWVAEGTSSQIQNLQDIDSSIFPWLMKKLLNRENVVIDDVSKMPAEAKNEKAEFENEDIKSLLVIPMYTPSNLVGLIGFQDTQSSRNWTDEDIKLLRAAADNVASVIERKRLEEKSVNLADKMQLLLGSTDEGIYGQDLEGRCTFFNKAASKMTGYSPDEVIGKGLHSLIHHSHKDSTPYLLEECPIFQSNVTGKSYRSDKDVFWRKDGTFFPVEYSSHLLIKKGIVEGTVVTFSDISQRKKIEGIIKYQAYHDTLTDLPNRRMFEGTLNSQLADVKRHGSKLAVIFLDLDYFKQVNDKLGHAVGDKLLKGVADRLKSILSVNETVARTGGDEFLIALTRTKKQEDVAVVARRILNTLEIPLIIEDNEINISASMGIALCPEDGEDISILIKNADTAMYYAKENGRKQFQFFISIEPTERDQLEKRARRAA